jgi:acetone carboxylase gamma subunit
VNKEEMGRACGTYREKNKGKNTELIGETKEKMFGRYEYNGRMTLKCYLNDKEWRVWTEFFCFRAETSERM